MGFVCVRYDNARGFLEAVGDMLYSRETVNNLILGVSERLVTDPEAYQDPFFASVEDESGEVLLAAVMTPPHNIILAGGKGFDQGLSLLAVYLWENKIAFPGVIGPVQVSESFMKSWQNTAKQSGRLRMRQRVYELRTVRMPPLPEGCFRIALPRDEKVIVDYFAAFSSEALGESGRREGERVRQLIANGDVFVWDRMGEVVSMAVKTLPIAHSITISGVYTPKGHRRKGYATALVARLSQHLLDLGYHFVNLFTNLENPTSNSIYKKIGYHPVCDFYMYKFDRENQQIL